MESHSNSYHKHMRILIIIPTLFLGACVDVSTFSQAQVLDLHRACAMNGGYVSKVWTHNGQPNLIECQAVKDKSI